ncbi:glutaredoxin family protein [Aureibaculum sp. 2210JD6-5]|uniref:glutaredoxin family protein n=1 Tax=Aureibaculum sp. 2210JD6-5 TaxID=3103957 RepID=UPI002AADBAF8|nr:glutaredoxin family protein [Aureibaculum sp. 2210JD6-5]MDY7395897.1 glutaredoxin family protein [Aureibaculum sp. 2210JD6-5]
MRTFIFSIILTFTFNTVSLSQELDSISEVSTAKNVNKMTIYGSDTCHYCLDTKAYLKERKIDFIYFDVDLNLVKQKEMLVKLQKAGIAVDNVSLPVVDFNGELFMNNGDFDTFLERLTHK